jgi:hypothetical protein
MTIEEGIRNVSGTHHAAAPKPPVQKHNPLEGHDVAVYVDGRRISVSFIQVEQDPDSKQCTIYAETTAEAALNPDIDAVVSRAWGGFKPLDMVGYGQSDELPASGNLQIMEMIPPTKEGEDAIFVCTAMSDVWNLKTSTKIASVGETVEIASRYARAQITNPF